MSARPRENRVFLAWATAVTLAVAALFYGRGRSASSGEWPAPLDDVYIHYDFARALAQGHPFEWIAGQGFSSGETSPLYACILAVGYAAGFRGAWLGVWAAIVACVSLVVMLRQLRAALLPAPAWVALLAVPIVFSCGTLDAAWLSGMEAAVTGAAAATLLATVKHARAAGPLSRPRAQWRVGLVGAALVLLRPEAAVLVAVATAVVARRSGVASPLASCARVALPGALATLAIAALNRAFTGDLGSAGAILKLLSSNPYATDVDRARDYVVNVALFARAFARDFAVGAHTVALLPLLLALASLTSRRTRGLGGLCLASALAFTLLVSWNGAARYQSFRYYMPAVALALFASALGISALASRPALRVVGAALAILGASGGATHLGGAASLYARASRNIHDQQVTVGRRLAQELPEDAIVLVGDAGAIPYFSGRHAIDALGLGGYHGVPFVRAAVLGEAATLELIERLPAGERPTALALYPNWFPGITERFGHERGRVTITDNVICGGVTKGIYDADWSTLAAGGDPAPTGEPWGGRVLDAVDVADVVSEEAHAYLSPAPAGGWTLFDVRTTATGARRFDAGRSIPRDQEESFAVAIAIPAGASVVVCTDDAQAEVTVSAGDHGSDALPLTAGPPVEAGRWRFLATRIPWALMKGERVRLRVTSGLLHDFHTWLVAGKP